MQFFQTESDISPDKYPFEIFIKLLNGPNNPATDADFKAAVIASKDDPGVRQYDQPYLLPKPMYIDEEGPVDYAGEQGRVTYHYMNGDFKQIHIEGVSNGTHALSVMKRLGWGSDEHRDLKFSITVPQLSDTDLESWPKFPPNMLRFRRLEHCKKRLDKLMAEESILSLQAQHEVLEKQEKKLIGKSASLIVQLGRLSEAQEPLGKEIWEV